MRALSITDLRSDRPPVRGAQLAHALLAPARRRERVAETGKVLAVDRAEIAHRLAVVAQPPQDVGVFRGGDSLLLLAVLVRERAVSAHARRREDALQRGLQRVIGGPHRLNSREHVPAERRAGGVGAREKVALSLPVDARVRRQQVQLASPLGAEAAAGAARRRRRSRTTAASTLQLKSVY